MRVDLEREKHETYKRVDINARRRLVENTFFRSFTITDKSNIRDCKRYQKFYATF